MDKRFYLRDTLVVAKELIGKTLTVKNGSSLVGGLITETEAYTEEDPECHAFQGKKTPRTMPMFMTGGTVYIYFIYGMYHCLNIVTEAEGRGCAVLIRGIHPTIGIETIKRNRGSEITKKNLTNGPGKLVLGLNIKPEWNKMSLTSSNCPIQIHQKGITNPTINTTTRVGIKKGKDFAWRFILKES